MPEPAQPPGPVRSCVGCREALPAVELVRFVLTDGVLVADGSGHAAGRGAWLHPRADCAKLARRRGGFARSFGARVDDRVLDSYLEDRVSAP